ncbi:MAG: P-type Mg2+ transporter [Streptosporangiaceae bacterium]|jgi:Mg2+-importing ATPase|nr:mgtA [Streptosporangiaceae bacterium]MDX6431199.1 P-type Mg2+ transporter [Streptosporangiaceae bacterium]
MSIPGTPMAWAPDSLAGAPVAGHRVVAQTVPLAQERLTDQAEQSPLTVLRRWESSPGGLDEREAQDRLLRHGEGGVPGFGARTGHLIRAVAAPFVVVLICLSAVSALTRDPRGAVLICLLAVLSGGLRLFQEYRSDRAAAALRAIVTTTATVLRRAVPDAVPAAREVPVEQVVPGDIVQLNPGDVVPADLRLLSSSDLTIDQAVLTGESFPAGKHGAWTQVPEPSDGPPELFDHPRLCFMGTTVVSGSGTAVAVATGSDTYFGATIRDLPVRSPETAFDRGVRSLSWALIAAMAAAIPVVLTVTGVVRGDWPQALLFAIAIAVAITPEMLPLVVTTLLVRGATGMARNQVIVKRLPAVHNLGAMDTLCIDKTGTLTVERVSLTCHLNPLGRPDPGVLRWACLNALWSVELTGRLTGDAIDEALLRHAGMLDGSRGVGVIPFDFARRRATVVLRPAGRGCDTLVTKGSVEDVLNVCTRVRIAGSELALDVAERVRLMSVGDRWAADGVRLLAVATAERPPVGRALTPADEHDLTFIGFVGFRDRPESSAAAALAALGRYGVGIVMITGDHPLVARRICRDAGLRVTRVVTGRDLAALDDAAVADLAVSGAAFARVGPPQKARIVKALQAAGRTVGYLGDGVNDAPALRTADVGISISGAADLARESADVILLGKDLRILEEAILTGRRTFANTVKYIKIAVASNVGNVMTMLTAGLMLPFLPMLPLQVLVQNMFFDLSQLSLVYDRVDESQIRRPRGFDLRNLAQFVACLGPLGTLFDLATFALFWRVLHAGSSAADQVLFHTGWFAENLIAQALALCMLRGRGRSAPRAAWPVMAAAAALGLSGLLLPFSPLAGILDLRPLPVAALPLLAAVLTAYWTATIGVRYLYVRLLHRWL